MMRIILWFFWGSVFILVLSLWLFYLTLRPFKIHSTYTPAKFHVAFENVEFKTKDGLRLKGWFIPSKKLNVPTIILLHGYPADMGDILPSRLFLQKYYNLLFFDFRYLGESEGSYSTLGIKEVADLNAALDYLKSRGIERVGVWGFSMGGAVALRTALHRPEIKAVIAESAYARLDMLADEAYPIPVINKLLGKLLRFWVWVFFRIDINSASPMSAVEKIKIPTLLIYSENDRLITLKHAILMKQVKSSSVKIIIVKDKQHGEPIENYQLTVLEFFKQYLGQ